MPCAYAQGIYKLATPLRFLQYNYLLSNTQSAKRALMFIPILFDKLQFYPHYSL